MKQKLLLFAGCALLLLPSTLPAKSPKGQHPQHVEPKVLVDQAKKELQKEIQTVRQEVEKARKELNSVRQEVDVVRQEVDVVRQESYRVQTVCFLQTSKVLPDRDPIPFPILGMPDSEIKVDGGIFMLPYDGVYLVTYGVTTSSVCQGGNHFELQLSGKPVVGGKVYTNNHSFANWCTGSITALVAAKAGEQLQILNVTGSSVSLGADNKDATAAYILILQVR